MLRTDDLVKLVSHGGGLILDASRKTTDDLVRIASHARKGTVILRNVSNKRVDDLVRIASHGAGRVMLDLT